MFLCKIAIETRIHHYYSKRHLYTLTTTTRTGRNDVSPDSIAEAVLIFRFFTNSQRAIRGLNFVVVLLDFAAARLNKIISGRILAGYMTCAPAGAE